MKNFKKYIASVVVILMTTFTSFGQGGSNVHIAVDDYQRTITSSEKVQATPQLNDSVIELPDVKFYIEPTYHEVTFETKPIKAAKLKVKEPLDKLYNGYVKAGLGTYTMPFLDAYYNANRSKTKSWGVNLKHHSSLTNLKKVGTNLFSDNEAGVFYKQFFRKYTFDNRLNYERNKYHYYGFSNSDTLVPESYRTNSDTTKQVYQQISYSAKLKSMHKDSSKISHTTNLDFYHLNGLTGISENNVGIASNIFKYLGKEEVGADVSLVLNHLKQPIFSPVSNIILSPDSETKYGNTVFKLNPFIKTRRGNLLAKVGLGIHSEITSAARFFFYPDLSVSYSLFNNIFVPYAGVTGGVQQNTFNEFRRENPFVLESISTTYLNNTVGYKNTNQRINLYGGFKGSVTSSISFNLKAQFEKLDNFAMFVNDTMYSYENKFNVEYDSIDKTTLSAQVGYHFQEKIKVFLKGEYYNYSMLTEEYAWQMPDYIVSLVGVYDLADKIVARANLRLVGGRKTYSLKPIENVSPTPGGKYITDLKPYLDANLGVEYRYNKRLSAFLDLNNILGQKYQRWANFPVYSFNLLGGITYSF
jgi:hypothetical protein